MEYAKSIGIDLIGFTDIEPIYEYEALYNARKGKGYLSGFEEKIFKGGFNPLNIIPSAKTVISVGLSYNVNVESEKKGVTGLISKLAIVKDYHVVMKDVLERLVEFLKRNFNSRENYISVDNGFLPDKIYAYKAGVGNFGKNSLIINPLYGSWMVLGEIITDVYFLRDEKMQALCNGCNRCLLSCPTGAILPDNQFNARRCLSYISVSKEVVPEELRIKMGDRIYGCDVCQEVCPYNKGALKSRVFSPLINQRPDLLQILNLSKKRFMEVYGQTSMAWRGHTVIQRNAIIALSNLKNDDCVEIIGKMLIEDPRPVIRYYSAWALKNFNSSRTKFFLERALAIEKDEMIKNEIKKSLEVSG